MKLAARAERIEPFYVMEVAKAADALLRESSDPRPMLRMNIGEPDFTAPPLVQEAAIRAVRDGTTQYTSALGLDALREAISGWYRQRFGVNVPAQRIVITAGASAALQLACLALIEAGDEVLMPDPCYPCNRHFVIGAEGRPILLPTSAAERYQLSAQSVRTHWNTATRGVLLASPSNPTGTSIAFDELAQIHNFVRAQNGITLLDEIYLGLSHNPAFGQTGLALGDDLIAINSFSKYFCMTGWRLGWLVAPEALIPALERLAQNFFICPSVVAQHAALACFEPESIAEYEHRRRQFQARCQWLVPALEQLGFNIPVPPDGAFYVWADASNWCQQRGLPNSWELTFEILRRTRVALTPGRDFGQAETAHFLRFSAATSMTNLEEAVARLAFMREW